MRDDSFIDTYVSKSFSHFSLPSDLITSHVILPGKGWISHDAAVLIKALYRCSRVDFDTIPTISGTMDSI